jgi:hypothetical protein
MWIFHLIPAGINGIIIITIIINFVCHIFQHKHFCSYWAIYREEQEPVLILLLNVREDIIFEKKAYSFSGYQLVSITFCNNAIRMDGSPPASINCEYKTFMTIIINNPLHGHTDNYLFNIRLFIAYISAHTHSWLPRK